MSDEQTARVFEELRKKYPGLTNEQLADIMKTGADNGLIEVASPEATSPSAISEPGEGTPEFEFLKYLKGGDADLDQVMRFMVIDNWIKERFGKGKELPPEVKEMLEKARSGKGTSDLDAFMERMMKWQMYQTFAESFGKPKAQQQPVDFEKLIREQGEQMRNALHEHKLEDEKARAEQSATAEKKRADDLAAKIEEHERTEEDNRRLEEEVRVRTKPFEEKYNALLKDIGDKLKGKSPEEQKGMLLDLGQMISEELGDEIKERITDSIKSAFSGDKETSAVQVTPDGKPAYDLYKLGERGLKTLEKFIEKIPTQPPPKKEVKEMPKLPPREQPKSTPSPPPTPPPTPTSAETATKTEPPTKPIITKAAKEEQKPSETAPSESTDASTSGTQP
jgi:hypothetical protein